MLSASMPASVSWIGGGRPRCLSNVGWRAWAFDGELQFVGARRGSKPDEQRARFLLASSLHPACIRTLPPLLVRGSGSARRAAARRARTQERRRDDTVLGKRAVSTDRCE